MSATTPADSVPSDGARASAGGISGRASVPGSRPTSEESRVSGRAVSGRASVSGGPRRDDHPAGPGLPGGPVGPNGPGGGGRGGSGGRRGPRPRWGRIGLVAGIAVLVLALLGGVGVWFYARGLNDDLARTDPFSAITNGRPAKQVEGAFNILLVGSDSRDPDAQMDKQSAWRADTIIVMHVPADHKHAYLVSIPRDLYVPIPAEAGAACDSGRRAKINAAFAFGGLPLAVRTVECFTDVRIDHVMAIDFAGFRQVTDALGGVDLPVDMSVTSIHKPYRKFVKGTQHMDGATALDWIRQRKQFPEGDFARMRHQQEFLRALMDKAASSGTLANPATLNAFLKSVTDAVTVDQEFSLVDMAVQFRSLRGNDLTFLTSPNRGSDMINGESVVVSDRERALALYQAITADRMADWLRANPSANRTTTGN